MQSGSTSTARTVAMVSADGPAPLTGTAPVEDRDGASRTWTIATGLGANREAGDGPEEVHLAGHRWSWFAGGPRGWRGEFELSVQTKLQNHMHKHMPNAEDEAVNSVHEEVSAVVAPLTKPPSIPYRSALPSAIYHSYIC